MKRVNHIYFLALCFSMSILGCGPSAHVVNIGGPTIHEAMSEPSRHGKMSIAIMDFENKSQYDVGCAMSNMLTSALFRTGRFILIDRERLEDVLNEIRLGTTGIISDETAIPIGLIESAELLIYGTVTEFSPATQGVNTTIGGIQQSRVIIDLKIIETRSGRIVTTTTVEGKSTDSHLDTSALQYVGMLPLYSLEIWRNTPVESAIRLCINNAADYIVNNLK